MHTGKKYDMTAALRAVGMKLAKGEEFDLRAMLKEHTDIPEERLDFATSEVRQLLFGLKQVMRFLNAIADTDDDLRELVNETGADKCAWIDDDKRNLNVNVFMDEDAAKVEEPLVSVNLKLKAEEESK